MNKIFGIIAIVCQIGLAFAFATDSVNDIRTIGTLGWIVAAMYNAAYLIRDRNG